MIEPSFEAVVDAVRAVVDQLSGTPEVLVAVGRGGLVVGVIASRMLGPHRFIPVMARTTRSDAPGAIKHAPVLEISPIDLTGASVVVIDDIVGSGRTITSVTDRAISAGASAVVVAAALQNLDNRTCTVPNDLVVGQAVHGWVRFPWERRPV